MRFRSLKSANGSRFNTSIACLSRFAELLSPAWISQMQWEVFWQFQCQHPTIQRLRKCNRENALKHFKTSTESESYLENGLVLQEHLQTRQWTELFKFPTDYLSLILFLDSSSAYCWVQNDVSFHGTQWLNYHSLAPYFQNCLCTIEKWKMLR